MKRPSEFSSHFKKVMGRIVQIVTLSARITDASFYRNKLGENGPQKMHHYLEKDLRISVNSLIGL
jgi:hypothetical protein